MNAFKSLFAKWDNWELPSSVYNTYNLHGAELAIDIGPFKIGQKLPLAIVDMVHLDLILVDRNGKQYQFPLILNLLQ